MSFFTDESGESETDNLSKGQQGKKPKKSNNSANNSLKTQNQNNNLTVTSYGRKTPIMTTRIHPGTKRISENLRKTAEVKTKPVSTAPTTGQFV